MTTSEVRPWMDRLRIAAASTDRHLKFMEVCGTHTMSSLRAGLPSLLPENVELLSGPGCPVCVTSQGDIDLILDLARRPGVILCTYGDMLRVPGHRGSLERARSRGADVRIIYSTMDAVRCARENPNAEVVLAAVGFETTAPATAAAILSASEEGLANFSALASHKRVLPAMMALVSGDLALDGFLCPGHVSVILGAETYRPVVEAAQLPCVVAGFEPLQMVMGVTRLTELALEGRASLENVYPQAVTDAGNTVAQAMLDRVFEPDAVAWRGLPDLPESGLVFRREFAAFDARERFGLETPAGRGIPGCRCGEVITGRIRPPECSLFGEPCTPVQPLGPCMVSTEGTCQAWFRYGRSGGLRVQEVVS